MTHRKLIELADDNKTDMILRRVYGEDAIETRSASKRREAIERAFEQGELDVSELFTRLSPR